ncbi:MAG: hypothetical protein CL471_15195 [Acidobacteria bacterium]|nr:hypothetical protein [Acidobacteriota bacterium]
MRQAVTVFVGFAGIATMTSACGAPPDYDVIIRGGSVLDGTGTPALVTDVGIRGDAIATVGDLSASTAAETIDAAGLTVTPGFIDMHSHSDYTLLVDPRALSKIIQGVTTELLGESNSAAPALGPARPELARTLDGLELALDWTTLGEYFARVERTPPSVNILSTVASGQIRAAVVGYDNRPATADELERMTALVDEAMRDGAVGLSSGLIYPPNSYAPTEELVTLARAAARHGGIYVSHIRNESDGLLDALNEAIGIGREAEIQVEVLHFKRSGARPVPSGTDATIQDAALLIEEAQAAGIEIYANLYPYAASQTTLNIRLPDWTLEGGREQLVVRLRDPETRERIRREVADLLAGDRGGATPATVMVGRTPYEPHRQYQGMRLAAIAEAMGVEPADALLEIIDRADGTAGGIFFGMREEDVAFAMALPWTTIGSDGTALAPDGILGRTHPHPRSYGSFARVLGHYARDEGVLTLPDAVRKITSLPAARLGLADRGVLDAGWRADVVVFDAETITDTATFGDPQQLAMGVRWVIVNGEVVVADGTHTGATPGRVLRHAAVGAATDDVQALRSLFPTRPTG